MWDWRDLGTPPRAGGLDDQPAGFLAKARYLEAIYSIMKRWYREGSKNFTQQERKLFSVVLKARKHAKR